MLAARGIFLAARRKPKLPYDAEVEYLESMGLQWIDTGIFHNYENAVRFKLRMPGFITYVGPYADYVNENTRCTRMIYSANNSNILLYHGSVAGSQGVVVSISSNIIEGYTSVSGYVVNGVAASANPGTPGVATRTMKLFYSNANGPNAANGARIWYFKIDNQIDLIPVRFTNELGQSEGAMYDRLGTGGMNPDGSPRTDGLYRNRGTGAFVFGPDKTA